MKRVSTLVVALLLLTSSPCSELKFQLLKPEEIKRRLQCYKGDDLHREAMLKSFFDESGCRDHLSEQPVKHLREPNLICILPGSTGTVIVVGAHYDHIARGDGVVDNWTGASMLPSLFQMMRLQPRKHTYVFISFAGEEKGLIGSEFYVRNLSTEERNKIHAMVNMDTLGLGPTEVWISHSDPKLIRGFALLAHAFKLPLIGMDVEQVGESDEESFNHRRIPTITIHSLTQDTLPILHSSADKYSAIKFDDYYNSYRLITAYLAYLDEDLDRLQQ